MATKLRWAFPPTIESIKVPELQTTVRSCLDGIAGADDQGAIKKTLYCTRDGKFFVRCADGWRKQEPITGHLRKKQKNGRLLSPGYHYGTTDCPQMRHFGLHTCHRLVAYAWCEHPACAKTDPLWYKHYEADHINGDHGNWTADNLQWVTPAENRRRAGLARCMRKTGLQPKWLYHSILRGLYSLPTEQAELVINRFRFEAGTNDDALTIERINSTFAFLLDELKKQPS